MKYDRDAIRNSDLVDVPEGLLVRYLIDEEPTLYHYFNFVVEPAIGPPPRKGWDYIFLSEVPREYLGLKPGAQPGDIDVIIIPTLNGVPQFDRTMAIEVKRLALRGPNWTKNVDRYGVTQAIGLARAGFPYVGILHLVLARPGPSQNCREVMQGRVIDSDGRFEIMGDTVFDFTGLMAAERQMDRLERQQLPDFVGLNAVAISHTLADGQVLFGCSETRDRWAKANPWPSAILVRNLAALIDCVGPRRLRNADLRKGHR